MLPPTIRLISADLIADACWRDLALKNLFPSYTLYTDYINGMEAICALLQVILLFTAS